MLLYFFRLPNGTVQSIGIRRTTPFFVQTRTFHHHNKTASQGASSRLRKQSSSRIRHIWRSRYHTSIALTLSLWSLQKVAQFAMHSPAPPVRGHRDPPLPRHTKQMAMPARSPPRRSRRSHERTFLRIFHHQIQNSVILWVSSER